MALPAPRRRPDRRLRADRLTSATPARRRTSASASSSWSGSIGAAAWAAPPPRRRSAQRPGQGEIAAAPARTPPAPPGGASRRTRGRRSAEARRSQQRSSWNGLIVPEFLDRPMELKATRYDVDRRDRRPDHLARPKRRNAWTGRMHTEYRWILREADADPAVRVIVVTGDPEGQAFCAGADLQRAGGALREGPLRPRHARRHRRAGLRRRPTLRRGLRLPLRGRQAGHRGDQRGGRRRGAGAGRLRRPAVRAPGAKFTAAHGRFNLPAEFGLSWVLPRIVGLTHANDILLSSRDVHGRGGRRPWASSTASLPAERADGRRCRPTPASSRPASRRARRARPSARSTATCTATRPSAVKVAEALLDAMIADARLQGEA